MLSSLLLISGLLATAISTGAIAYARLSGARCERKHDLASRVYFIYIAPDFPISAKTVEDAFTVWAPLIKKGTFRTTTNFIIADVVLCRLDNNQPAIVPLDSGAPANFGPSNFEADVIACTGTISNNGLLRRAVIAVDNVKLKQVNPLVAAPAFKIMVHEFGHLLGWGDAFKQVGPFKMYPSGHPMNPHVEKMGIQDWSGIVD